MSHIYKVQEWQNPIGKWYCNDVSDLAGISGKWWIPARLLKLALTDYILLLKNEYHANIINYNKESDVLIFNWDNYQDCHRYVLYINRVARETNFKV